MSDPEESKSLIDNVQIFGSSEAITTAASTAASTDSEVDTFEDILTKIGYGRFHWCLLFIMAWAISSDTVEIVSISFVLPTMECDLHIGSFEKGVLNAVIFVGMIIGGLTWGSMGDKMGRRRVLIICLFINGTCALLSSVAQTYWLFLILRLLSGVGVGGSYPVAFTYIVEFQPANKRGFAVGLLCSFWMFAGIGTAGLAWALVPHSLTLGIFTDNFTFNAWRIFIAICTVPAFSSALMIIIILPESPKYLLQMNRKKEALKVLNSVSTINSSDYLVKDVILVKAAEKNYIPSSRSKLYRCLKVQLDQLRIMFSESYRRPVILVIIIYFSLAFGYYGLLLWLPELYSRIEKNGGGSICMTHHNSSVKHNDTSPCDPKFISNSQPYWEGMAVNAANLPGNLISVILIDRVGRRLMLFVSMLLTAAATGFIPFLQSGVHVLIITCIFGAVSAVGWNSLSVVSTEVTPTVVRSSTLGVALSLSRVAAISGNLVFGGLIDVHCAVPLLIGASFLIIGSISGLFLPNTVGIDVQ